MNGKYCPFCGAHNEEMALFCSECGNKLPMPQDKSVEEKKAPVIPVTEEEIPVEYDGENAVDVINPVEIPITSFETPGVPVNPEGINNRAEFAPQKPKGGKTNAGVIVVICVLSLLIIVGVFTVVNILVCEDIISGQEGSFIENYEDRILGVYSSVFGKNVDESTEPVTEPDTNKTYEEKTTDKEADDSKIWTPDDDYPAITKNGGNPQGTDSDISASNGSIYIVNVGDYKLNLRESPSTDSEILTQIPNATILSITEIKDGWGYTSYDNESGWVSMEFVEAYQ